MAEDCAAGDYGVVGDFTEGVSKPGELGLGLGLGGLFSLSKRLLTAL